MVRQFDLATFFLHHLVSNENGMSRMNGINYIYADKSYLKKKRSVKLVIPKILKPLNKNAVFEAQHFQI